MERNLVIIGGGPAGYVAAIRAAQLGIPVTVIEKAEMGGTCLNRGCIPTKALYKNAEMIHTLSRADAFGITLSEFTFDMPKIQTRKNEVVEKMRSGIEQLMKGNKIEVLKGEARFTGVKTLEVVSTEGDIISLSAKNIIVATGSVPSTICEPGMDSGKVISSDEALELNEIPKSMVICGGGVIGIEFAGIFASFGTEVTVIECMPRILMNLDEEVSKRLNVFLKRKKVKIDTSVRIKEVRESDGILRVIAETGQGDKEYDCETLLMAAGRTPNITGLDLEAAGIAYDRKGIKVNGNYETSAEGIYAVGDVIGGQMLAHVASEEGKACVERICGRDPVMDYEAVPSCIFSFPEIASVGMTEERAKNEKIDYLVGKFAFAANGKAMTLGETDGFVKIIADRDSHRILGVHIIGTHASDLISEGVLAVKNKMTIEQIEETIHSHPTLPEAFVEAAMDAKGKAVHNLPR